ncbi:hypothetical protein [Trueperella sp. LYQ143]|uniref:hypothetical protein n=1 Tax=Trueperella sp. LYQ143 TaxID=3391059 RepID=UPI0039835C3F
MSRNSHNTAGRVPGIASLTRLLARGSYRSASTWVVCGIFTLMALTSALIAKYTPRILSALADPALAEFMSRNLGEPSWSDAYSGWIKNLNQICIFSVIIVGALRLHSQMGSSEAHMILTRPIKRSSYLLAHVFTLVLTLLATLAITTAIAGVTTRIVFGHAPLFPLLEISGIWLLFALVIICAMALAEAIFLSLGATLGVGIAVYVFVSIGGAWHWGSTYTPLGLLSTMSALANASHIPTAIFALKLLSTVFCAGVLLVAAMWRYERRDLC